MTLAFRELWAETNQIAGFHDGTNLQISSDFLDNQVIRLHEEMHGRIFEETADGKLHICLIKLINRTQDQVTRKRLEMFNSRLFSNTRVPHERVATYLGITILPTASDMELALAALTGEYKDYYSFFDRLLARIPTTFVRFSVAWGLGRAAFSSSRFESIGDLDDLLSGAFLETPGPAARLNQLGRAVAAMEPDGFYEFITAKMKSIEASNDLPPFDFDSEDEWKARAGQVASQRLDRLLIEEVERFACGVLGSELKTRYKIPKCFLVVEDSLRSRRFVHEFPVENGKPILSAEAAKFYSRDLDFQRINRPGLQNVGALIQDSDIEFVYDTLMKAKFDQLHLAVVAMRTNANVHFSMIITGRELDAPEFDFGVPIVGQPDNFNRALAAVMLVCENYPTGRPRLSISVVQELLSQDIKDGQTWGIQKIRLKLPRIIRQLPIEPLPDPHEGIVPYLYAREMWSGLLATVDGTLVTWRTVLNTEKEEAKEFVICVLYPDDTESVPYLAVMTYWCNSEYLRYAADRIKSGKIRVVSNIKMTNEIMKTVTALWFSYKVV
jgi:hypothetical protein